MLGIVKNYTYDSADNKSTFAVMVGGETKLSLEYCYDGAARLSSVRDAKGKDVVSYTYDENGRLSTKNIAEPQLATNYAYNYQDCLVDMKNQTGNSGVISEFHSNYLLNGQKSQETSTMMDNRGEKTEKAATYTYDLLGRLTKETKTGNEEITYEYDSHNNRKALTVGNKKTAYRYNKNDELVRSDTLNIDTEEDSVVIYKNDKNGNQLATVNRYEIPSDKKDSTYVDVDVTLGDNRLNENVVNHYDALNQLTQTLTKNYKVSFAYDADGLRTSKTVNGEKTVFVWDGDQLVMELSASGKVKRRYIRGNDLICTDNGDDSTSGEVLDRQYYVMNPHGDVVQLVDESGAVTKAYEYDSFGNEVIPDSKDENPFRYSGEYYDKETGEVYLRARYYQPETGRFLTRDTYTGKEDDPLSLHLYTYCENDGVNEIDPSGHWSALIIHRGVTEKIAFEVGFDVVDAGIVALGCYEGDRLVPKDKEWKMRVYNTFTFKTTIVHASDLQFNIRKNTKKNKYKASEKHKKKQKLKIQQVTKAEYSKVMHKAKYDPDYSSVKNMAVCGVWLHAIQDRWAHGLDVSENNKYFLKHKGKKADSIWQKWVYKNGKKDYKRIKKMKKTPANMKKLFKKNKRLKSMIDETYKFLIKMKNSARKYEKTKFFAKSSSKNDVYNVVAKYLSLPLKKQKEMYRNGNKV